MFEFFGKKKHEDFEVEGKPYKEWRRELETERLRRSVPAEGLTLNERFRSEILAKRWVPVFGGPQKRRRLSIRGGKLLDIDRIINVPWPDEIQIQCNTYIKDGEEINYISMSAGGPNGDGTYHHGAMGYLPDYSDRQTMLESAIDIVRLVYRLTGHKPYIYIGDDPDEGNQHARWCFGEIPNPPAGYGYDRFMEDYS